jgi:hypothetical protein
MMLAAGTVDVIMLACEHYVIEEERGRAGVIVTTLAEFVIRHRTDPQAIDMIRRMVQTGCDGAAGHTRYRLLQRVEKARG